MTRQVPGACMRAEERIVRGVRSGRVGHQGGKVVGEDISAGIVRVVRTTRPRIAGAQVAARIMSRALFLGQPFHLALPRPLRTLGRHLHPFAGQRVETAVGERQLQS